MATIVLNQAGTGHSSMQIELTYTVSATGTTVTKIRGKRDQYGPTGATTFDVYFGSTKAFSVSNGDSAWGANAWTTWTLSPASYKFTSQSVTITFKNLSASITNVSNSKYTFTVPVVQIPTSESFTYDGTSKSPTWAVTAPTGITIGGTKSGTAAGTKTATATPKSGYTWPDGTTTAKNITWTINKRKITITGGSKSQVFNDASFSYNNATLTSGTIASGQTATYSSSGSRTTVGTIDNVPAVAIVGSDGTTSVLANYEVTKVNGTLTVTARPITITGKSASVTYNGTTQTHEGASLTSGTLPSTCTATYSSTCDGRTSVGTVAVVPNVVIKSGSTDRTSQFNITKVNGTLTVNARKITIKGGSKTQVYDATQLTYDYATVSSGSIPSADVAVLGATGARTPVGATDNVPTITIYRGSTSGANVTSNYEITKTNGTLTVTARPITVTANSVEKVYNGTAQSVNGCTATNLASTHKVTCTSSASRTAAGTTTHTLSGVSVTTSSGGTDVSSNYDITKVNGAITITKRPITITGGSKTKYYDETALTYNSATITSGSIPSADTATLSASGTRTKPGTADNVPSIDIVRDGASVASNYTITKVNGTLTVNSGAVYIYTSSSTFKQAVPYVYTSKGWQRALAYTYKTSWKEVGD